MEQNVASAMLYCMFSCNEREIQDRRNRYHWVCNFIRNYEAGKQKLYSMTIEELRAERDQLKQKYGF